jgi:hypothetical protein
MRLHEILFQECAGVGKIVPGVNKTPDVQPGEIRRQGEKFGFDLSPDGEPPSIWTTVRKRKRVPNRPQKKKTPE